MWLEVKALLSSVGIILVGIVFANIFIYNTFLSIILLIAIGVFVFGDMLIGYQITHNELKPLMDPTPKGKELMELQMLDGMVRYINTTKAPLGQRKFRIHNEDATVINDGRGSFRTINGNHGFRAHEKYDRNVEPGKCEALSHMKGDDIKEIYHNAKNNPDEVLVE